MFPLRTLTTLLRRNDVRYLLVGGLAAGLELVSFFILQGILGTKFITLSQILSFIVGLFSAFLGHRLWSFRPNPHEAARLSARSQFLAYFTLAIVNIIITSLLIHVLVSCDVHPLVAKITLMAAVVLWNFVILQKIIFRRSA